MGFNRTVMCRRFAAWMCLLANLVLGIAVWGSIARHAAAGERAVAQAFETSRAVMKAATEKLVSAVGTGEFAVFMQHKDEDEPKLWSKAKVHVYFDRGKYHVQIAYEKRLQQFSTTVNGKTTSQIEDLKDDEVRIIADDGPFMS